MPESLDKVVAAASVDAAVFALRPDYRALLVAVDGLEPGPSNAAGDALLQRAETFVHQAFQGSRIEQLPHIAEWREAYRAFGAKPQRTRSSVEALTRRAATGLPRVDRLTDTYNAISVLHQLPIGGEDLAAYCGAAQLVRATGTEPFDTATNGFAVVEYPDPGEVVWCDDTGVTCRRWNWRQARRTRLNEHTTAALFILDALGATTAGQLDAAADDLVTQLRRLGPEVRVARRLLTDTSRKNLQENQKC